MKKIFTLFVILLAIIGMIYIVTKTDIMINIAKIIEHETSIGETITYYGYYYNKLSDTEQGIYESVYMACIQKQEQAIKVSKEKITENNINKAMTAVIFDNPAIFYIDSSYVANIKTTLLYNVVDIQLTYIYDKSAIDQKIKELDTAVDAFINANINSEMSDYEKEKIIHDYLCSNIKYYEYKNIEDIPPAKHTVYSALIEKVAVCDGISKAFELIANKCGLDTIIISGTKDDVAHAWNIVNIDGATYHLDVTADLFETQKGILVPIYAGFNLNDKELVDYVIDNIFVVPNCNAVKYNYYVYTGTNITSVTNFDKNIYNLVKKNKNKYIFEVRIVGVDNLSTKFAQALYNANFNNYKTNRVTSVNYSQTMNSYIVEIT